ncbi:MAG: HAD family hydrolase [Trueperaceae bacterium]
MIKAVCFDLDGTLGRYTGDFGALAALLRSELDLHMCDMNSFAELLDSELRRDGALSLAVVLERVLERLEQRPPADLAAIASATVNAYAEDVRAYPGAKELLERLDAAGIKLALLSNGPDDMQKAALHALGLARFFRVVLVSGDRDVAARKPAPRIFSLACAGLQTVPEETLMVGDNLEADVGGALDYGLHAVLIDHAAGGARDAVPEGVGVVGSLEELERLLRQDRVISPGPQGAR